eukprot:CAMPEP_0118833224 /NCGR_PEP_ID=MMETSP1162-20130426/43339_1 /TAXON_ID=33656 /ORGANISM="Phaeocystis Sp, Strain CCMP2710" /LENGTH=43 /DNA_ID= /DNA_START= /DNA_END= /DNA_ORIENTATION=
MSLSSMPDARMQYTRSPLSVERVRMFLGVTNSLIAAACGAAAR